MFYSVTQYGKNGIAVIAQFTFKSDALRFVHSMEDLFPSGEFIFSIEKI